MQSTAFLAAMPLQPRAQALSADAGEIFGARIGARIAAPAPAGPSRHEPERAFEVSAEVPSLANKPRDKRVKPVVVRHITFEVPEGARGKIYVCQHSICHKQNSEAALAWFKDLVPDDLIIERGPCLGHCAAGPNTGFIAPGKEIVLVTGADSSLKMREALNREFGVTVDDILVDIIRLKQKGNRLFSANRNTRALDAFNQALELCEGNMSKANVPRLRTQLLSNRSAVHLAKKETDKALADAEAVIAANPAWWKGYARKAEALAELGDAAGAKALYLEAAQKSNGDKEVLEMIDETLAEKGLAPGLSMGMDE